LQSERRLLAFHVCPSVCMEQNDSHRTHFGEISYLGISIKFVGTFRFCYNRTEMTDTLREDLCYSCAIGRYNGDSVLCYVRAEAEETTDDQTHRLL
jgi:hypothetical protein